MIRFRKISSGLALLIAAAAGLAACSSGSSHPGAAGSAASSAAARASALAHSPQMRADEARAARELEACAKSTAGLNVSFPLPGQSGTPSVSGMKLRDLQHPVDTIQQIVACTPAGKSGGRKTMACAEQVAARNGLGRGKLAMDFMDTVTMCLVGQK